MTKRIAAVDIGGSGCRATWVDVEQGGRHHVGQVHHLGSPGSRAALAAALRQALGPIRSLGVSTAGIVDSPRGEVKLCRVQPWIDGELASRLSSELGQAKVCVVNDGEAHLHAHLHRPEVAHPVLCFTFGTSVGFGMTTEDGTVSRPRRHSNWEIGDLRVPTRASKGEAWWALGSQGLEELQRNMGYQDGTAHFGYRIGGLIRDFTALFQPRTVVLAGGIIDHHHATIVPTINAEIDGHLPAHIERPNLVVSPFGDDSGLVGAAVAAT